MVLAIAFVARTGVTAQSSPIADPQAAFETAGAFEIVGEFAKAEEQFVAAARSPDPKLRASALLGLQRVRSALRSATDTSVLSAAREYERLERWQQARDEYSTAMKSVSPESRQAAVDGFRKADSQLSADRLGGEIDSFLLWLGRLAAVALLLLWGPRAFSAIKTTRRSIKVLPFVAADDKAVQEVMFWIAYARSGLRAQPPSPPGSVLLATSSLPYIELPNLPSEITDVADLEFASAKIGLKSIVEALGRPQLRISGAWMSGSGGGRAYAEIDQRGWFRYAFHSRVIRVISASDADRATDLEVFGYDVLIHAMEAHGN
jgi:hypothetical protein